MAQETIRRPLIGICSRPGEEDPELSYINSHYAKAIQRAGGIPVALPYGFEAAAIAHDIIDRIDGLLLTGGGDVSEEGFGGNNYAKGCVARISFMSADRDVFEWAAVRAAWDANKPCLGICRGMQVLNVALGGTLIQDLPKAGKNNHSLTDHKREERTHEIIVKEGTRLSQILKEEKGVNSFHHQGIDVLGKGLIVSAYSKDDKVIEAVEAQGDRYILAVQWHPEELVANKGHLALFEEFIDQVNRVRQ